MCMSIHVCACSFSYVYAYTPIFIVVSFSLMFVCPNMSLYWCLYLYPYSCLYIHTYIYVYMHTHLVTYASTHLCYLLYSEMFTYRAGPLRNHGMGKDGCRRKLGPLGR